MTAYYNEHDPKAAAWLRELIKAGLIAPGIVDERSIVAVNPYELTQYTQHHFFAGIGGWSYALRLAGWPDDKPVVTGSCPCQPFSAAGQQLGTKDERHLWPVFRNCITFLGASTVFGEQVASPIALGWLDSVFADLEGEGYACAAADLCAASVGAPHIRQRLYWMANAGSPRSGRNPRAVLGAQAEGSRERSSDGCFADESIHRCADDGLAERPWSGCSTIYCTDGKTRLVEPSVQPLAHGIPDRVGLLRGYGNAIVPQVAAEFIKAAIESITQ